MLGSNFASYSYLPSSGVSGGVLIACRSPEITCAAIETGNYSVTVSITTGAQTQPWCLTSVYGPQPDEDKIVFLDELRSIHSRITGPWMNVGDFNLILCASDKSNDYLNRRNMGRFRRFVNELQLKDVYLHGRRYTWSNERACPTLEKLDRILVTVDWELNYPGCLLQALASGMSDHCTLLLATNANFSAKRRFHFENWWIKMPGFEEALQKVWTCSELVTDPFTRLDAMLRNTAKELQSLEEYRLRKELKIKSLGLSSLERTMI